MIEPLPKNVVVVLGMHRSGTSLCMNILHFLGIQLDSDLPPDEFNPSGYFESRELLDINEAILKAIGRCWHSILPDRMNDDWVVDESVQVLQRQLVSLITDRINRAAGMWALKDPRICLLLPLYQRVFQTCNITPMYVVCLRNPAAIARSLERRNQMPHLLSELLWMDHSLRALAASGVKTVIHYEDWFLEPMQQLARLQVALELPCDVETAMLETALKQIVNCKLDHGGAAMDRCSLSSSEAVYQFLRTGNYDAAAREFSAIQRALQMGISPALNSSQLFWRTTKEIFFTEANSCCRHTDMFSGKGITAHLAIPPQDHPLTGLRLDPADLSGLVQLLSIRLFASDHSLVWEWNGDFRLTQDWQIANMTLLIPAPGIRGVLAYFHKGEPPDPSLILPVGEEQLRLISEIGGFIDLEFAWEQDQQSRIFTDFSKDNVNRIAHPAWAFR